MLQIKNLRIRSFDLDYNDIYWEIEPTREEVEAYDFYVLRGETELGLPIDYTTIAGPFIDQYHVRDTTIRGQFHINRRWYYKIRVVNRNTREETVFPEDYAVALGAEPDLAALEMARMERLRLAEFSGRQVFLFPIRTFGQLCTCIDPITQKKVRDKCLTCFDTRFVGGY